MKLYYPDFRVTVRQNFSLFVLSDYGINCQKIRYDTRCYFNMRSKANMSQLNLPHEEVLSASSVRGVGKTTHNFAVFWNRITAWNSPWTIRNRRRRCRQLIKCCRWLAAGDGRIIIEDKYSIAFDTIRCSQVTELSLRSCRWYCADLKP